MTQIHVCTKCKKIKENNGKEPCKNCGSTEFTIKEVPEEQKQSEVEDEMGKNNNQNKRKMVHIKIDFTTPIENSRILAVLQHEISKLKTIKINENSCKDADIEEAEKVTEKKKSTEENKPEKDETWV